MLRERFYAVTAAQFDAISTLFRLQGLSSHQAARLEGVGHRFFHAFQTEVQKPRLAEGTGVCPQDFPWAQVP